VVSSESPVVRYGRVDLMVSESDSVGYTCLLRKHVYFRGPTGAADSPLPGSEEQTRGSRQVQRSTVVWVTVVVPPFLQCKIFVRLFCFLS
jgi:hypothetical protein